MFLVGPSCDNWNYSASNPCLYVGGNYNQNGNYGLFYVNYNTASNTSSNIGSRHLRRRKLRTGRLRLKAKASSLRCSASPHANRYAGFARGPHQGEAEKLRGTC